MVILIKKNYHEFYKTIKVYYYLSGSPAACEKKKRIRDGKNRPRRIFLFAQYRSQISPEFLSFPVTCPENFRHLRCRFSGGSKSLSFFFSQQNRRKSLRKPLGQREKSFTILLRIQGGICTGGRTNKRELK